MKTLFFAIIISLSSYILIYIWGKIKIKNNFKIYKDNLFKVTSSLTNITSKDLDGLASSGLLLIVSLCLCLVPYYIAYHFIFYLTFNYTVSILLSSIIFIPLFFKKKK